MSSVLFEIVTEIDSIEYYFGASIEQLTHILASTYSRSLTMKSITCFGAPEQSSSELVDT